MEKIDVAVKGLIIQDGKLLIAQRSKTDSFGAGTWENIGGGMHFGEDFEQALKREFLEEVGLTIRVKELLYASTFFTNSTRQIIILVFLCETDSTEVVLSSEHEQFLWATKEEAVTLLHRAIIDDFTQHQIFERFF